eukprot:scaffold80322_cov26-Tisochrysis_lutea.AAC.2
MRTAQVGLRVAESKQLGHARPNVSCGLVRPNARLLARLAHPSGHRAVRKVGGRPTYSESARAVAICQLRSAGSGARLRGHRAAFFYVVKECTTAPYAAAAHAASACWWRSASDRGASPTFSPVVQLLQAHERCLPPACSPHALAPSRESSRAQMSAAHVATASGTEFSGALSESNSEPRCCARPWMRPVPCVDTSAAIRWPTLPGACAAEGSTLSERVRERSLSRSGSAPPREHPALWLWWFSASTPEAPLPSGEGTSAASAAARPSACVPNALQALPVFRRGMHTGWPKASVASCNIRASIVSGGKRGKAEAPAFRPVAARLWSEPEGSSPARRSCPHGSLSAC